jgi:hypothetical protein
MKLPKRLGDLANKLQDLRQSLLRELTVNLDSKLTEDNRLVFSGKAELPIAAEIYGSSSSSGTTEPVSDRVTAKFQ